MNEVQRLFLTQARENFASFRILRQNPGVPECQLLYFLQMATELLGKANAWRGGKKLRRSHRAFVSFLREISTNRQAQYRLGYRNQKSSWEHLIRKSIGLAERVEELAPALAGIGPNVEYPWPPDTPRTAPVDHSFPIWGALSATADGRQFIGLIEQLFREADAFL